LSSSFIRSVVSLAMPITIQQLVSSSGGIIDNLMVAGLGTKAIGAVGAINKFIQVFWFSIHGLTSGGASFTSQFAARNDSRGIKKILGVTLFLNLAVAILFTFLALFYADGIVRFFTHDEEIIKIAKMYLFSMAPYFVLSAVPYSYSYPLRSLGKAQLSMYIMFFAQAVNIFFNYALITGNMGFPALGVAGAAIATVFSKVVETTLMLSAVYFFKYEVAATLRELLSFSIEFLQKYLRVVSPLAINEVLWSLGLMLYQKLIGGMNADAMAAYGMLAPFEQLLISAFSGLANAALTLSGKELGAQNYKKAYKIGIRFSYIGPILALLIGIPVAIFSEHLISIYSLMSSNKSLLSQEAFRQASYFLRILGMFMFVRIFNLVSFAGVLKSGGDTIFLFFVETGSLWMIGIPIVYFSSLVGLSPYIVYFSTYIEEGIKAYFIRKRLISKKWMNTLVDLD
tara:strand:+ start:4982 stop:6346 length:1365 start_codon:yes stop_codon:yes gene_type:complete